jgi:hypothetical protein
MALVNAFFNRFLRQFVLIVVRQLWQLSDKICIDSVKSIEQSGVVYIDGFSIFSQRMLRFGIWKLLIREHDVLTLCGYNTL